MIEFVIGGTAQGKLKYVLDKNNLTKEDVCNGEECDYNNINKKSTYYKRSEKKNFSSTLTVALIRHGLTEGNKDKKYIGITDESLSLNGIYALFDSISKEIYPRANKVYSSPMKRCVESAKMIYPKAEIIIKDDLKETNFGDFENKNYDQLKDDLNYQRWLASGGTFHIPNGESREEFSERCEKCFEEIINQSLGEECVALIIHGGTIMAILDKYSNPHKDFYNWQVKNGQGYIIEIDKNTWINDKKVQVIKEI